MIDIFNQVFTALHNGGIPVKLEYPDKLADFPCVVLEETYNVIDRELIDSSNDQKHSRIRMRARICSNDRTKKHSEARGLFEGVDVIMWTLGFRRTSYASTPNAYSATIYEITVTYEAVVDSNGYMYRNQ